jgi:hypothetical protein
MAKYEITDQVKNNIFEFLNRVDFKGINECVALNEIIKVLSTPIQNPNETQTQDNILEN